MTEIFTAVGNFGFPVVVAFYLLFRFETKIEKLDVSISDPEKGLIVQLRSLKDAVDNLAKRVNKNTEGQP